MFELNIVYLAVGALLAANLLAFILHIIRNGLPEGEAKAAVQKVIYELDRAADNMENAQKRAAAIGFVKDTLGWKRILVPTVVIGLIIDIEVAAIRKMEQVTNTPDLHKEGE